MNVQQLMTAISTDKQTITQICGILGLTISSDGTVSEIATNLNDTQLNLKPFFEKMAVDAKQQNKTLLEIAHIYTRSFQQQMQMQLQQTDRFSAKELFRQRFGIDPEQAQPGSQAYDTWQYLNRVYIPGAENIHAFGRETQARTILDLALDPDLLSSGLFTYDGNIFTNLGMDRGHLSPDRDRRRHPKDQLATYLTSNLIAYSMDNNRFFVPNFLEEDSSAWSNIENRLFGRATQQGQELYIFAGAIGNNWNSQKKTNVPELLNEVRDGVYINKGNTNPNNLLNRQIHIPKWTWKTIIAVEQPGSDVTSSNLETFAYITPNKAEPDWNNVSPDGVANPLNNDEFSRFLNSERGNITNATAWRNPDTWKVTLPELTNILNERNRQRNYDFNFDFLSNLPENIRRDLNNQGKYSPPS